MGFLDRIKESAKQKIDQISEHNEAVKNVMDAVQQTSIGVTIPVSSKVICKLLNNVEVKDVSSLDVAFEQESIQVSGKAKKSLLTIPFTLTLRPVSADGRKLYLSVMKITPINMEGINKRIFSQPPYVSYEDQMVCIDLNGAELIAKVPVGKVKSFYIKDDQLHVVLGI